MSCYNQCLPCLPCGPCGPTPLANSCNEPCVQQCQDSTVVIQPSPVVVTLPGPILSSQGVPISSGGFGLSGLGSGYCGRRCHQSRRAEVNREKGKKEESEKWES
ncbi:Feather keratin 1 [Aix galericulata]|nr:Feather keratin 1 [Aix galericulata]